MAKKTIFKLDTNATEEELTEVRVLADNRILVITTYGIYLITY